MHFQSSPPPPVSKNKGDVNFIPNSNHKKILKLFKSYDIEYGFVRMFEVVQINTASVDAGKFALRILR